MQYKTRCQNCDARVVVEIVGEDIRATYYEPAEYAYAELISRDCEKDGEDACEMTDERAEREALSDYNARV